MNSEVISPLEGRRFKRLRYGLAGSVVAFYIGKLAYGIVIDLPSLKDGGPSVRNTVYAFGLNDLIIALLPAAVLTAEFEFVTDARSGRILRAACVVAGIAAILGAALLLREKYHLLEYGYFEIGLLAHTLRQALIVLAVVHVFHSIRVQDSSAESRHA